MSGVRTGFGDLHLRLVDAANAILSLIRVQSEATTPQQYPLVSFASATNRHNSAFQ
jgi:hypothetical protein